MKLRSIFLVIAVVALAAATACRTNLFSGDPTNSNTAKQEVPPAPVVVDGMRTSYADVVEKTSPAVVRIATERKAQSQMQQSPWDDFFRDMVPQRQQPQPQQKERGAGSGVVVKADGTILTNHHVIDGADKILVQMVDNKTYEAKVVGSDPPSDLAVLKIEAENLPFLTLGDSDRVRVGDIVLAIGNPLGIGQTVTGGIISAKGRQTGLSDGSSFQDFLQTDAPINRGNSGGALVSLSGELIGINSQILSGGQSGGNIGIGFAIPSNMAKNVLEQILKDGKVRRGLLGINIQNLTDDVAKSLDLNDVKGVLVTNVKTGSAAEKAGIKRGDIITAINGEKVEDGNSLRNRVAGTLPGSDVKVNFIRDGKEQEATAVLDEFSTEESNSDKPDKPGDSDKSKPSGKLGLDLKPLSPEDAKQLQMPPDVKGLLVVNVDPNGAAAEEGMARGDVVMEVNRQPVETLDQMQSALERSGDRPILLLVARRNQVSYLTVKPK